MRQLEEIFTYIAALYLGFVMLDIFLLLFFDLLLHIGGGKKLSTLVITLISVAGAIFLAIFIFLVWRFKAKLKGRMYIFLPFSE